MVGKFTLYFPYILLIAALVLTGIERFFNKIFKSNIQVSFPHFFTKGITIEMMQGLVGIAHIAIKLKQALWGTLFSGQFEQICQIIVFTVYKYHKASWQALTPSLTKANTHLNFNFHCTSAPNHPGKGSESEPQTRDSKSGLNRTGAN